jgi:hypothetical protein
MRLSTSRPYPFQRNELILENHRSRVFAFDSELSCFAITQCAITHRKISE